MSAGNGFWVGAHCMWCGAVEGSAHTVWCKRKVGITDGPSKSAIDAHRAAQPVPTLGDIAEELRKFKDIGVTRESLLYVVDRVWWEHREPL